MCQVDYKVRVEVEGEKHMGCTTIYLTKEKGYMW